MYAKWVSAGFSDKTISATLERLALYLRAPLATMSSIATIACNSMNVKVSRSTTVQIVRKDTMTQENKA
jgi:hypothetical protein